MKSPQPHRGFVTHDLLITIAVVAVWLSVAAPIYATIIERFSSRSKPTPLLAQFSALGIAAVSAALLLVAAVAMLDGLIRLGELLITRLKRPR